MKQKKAWVIGGCTVALIIVGIAGYFIFQHMNKDEVSITFAKDTTVEYGDTVVTSKTFVKSSEGNITDYPKLDVKKIGKQKLIYTIENGSTKEEITHTVQVKDTKQPVITLHKDSVEIMVGDEYDITSNIKSVIDPVDGKLSYQEKLSTNSYTLKSTLNTSEVGEYEIQVVAEDMNKNQTKASFVVKVVAKEVSAPEENETSQNSNTDRSPTYINGILLVNKDYGLPQNFGATDPTAYAKLIELIAGANAAGYEMPILSGFRDYNTQVGLYNAYVERDGKEAADRYSARPGFSEHQSGLCFDIGQIDDYYGDTQAGKWLNEHCADYGYIIRYPNGKEHITGYMYEPWHVRYVGVNAAKTIMSSGTTLEEYLGVK